MPAGKVNVSGSLNGSVVNHPRSFPYDGRVQTFLDGRPDGEGRTEVVAFDNEVRSVADTDIIDRGEQLVRRIPGEDVGHARFDTHSDKSEETTFLPFGAESELLVTEFDPGLRVGVRWVGVRERHRHIHIGRARSESRPEDRHHEAGIHRVEDRVTPLGPQELRRRQFVRGVQLHPRKVIRGRPGGPIGAQAVRVGDDDLLEGIALRRNAGEAHSRPPRPRLPAPSRVWPPRELPFAPTLSAPRPW